MTQFFKYGQASTVPSEESLEDLLYFEDLQIGKVWISPPRIVSGEDVQQFAHLTGDLDPLHTDPEFAAESPYGRPIAHGLFGLSLLAGMSSVCPRLKTFAFTEIRDWVFRRPIYFGDTITAEAEVVNLRPRGRRCGEVIWARRLRNQLGEVVQQGTLVTLVACRFTANGNGHVTHAVGSNVVSPANRAS